MLQALLHHFLTFTAAHSPHRAALLVRDGTLTFGHLAARSGALAAWLQRAGLVRGDRVAIVADNCVELVIALWAVLRAGGVFVLINPTTKADKLAYILDDCDVRGVVAQRRLSRTVLPALEDAPSVSTAVWVGGVPERAGDRRAGERGDPGDPSGPLEHADYDQVLADPDGAAEPDDPGLIDADLAGLIYTSGSTGQPKGVMLTHRNLVHNTWSISTYLGLRDDDVVACLLPLSFDYGLFQIFMAARVGCPVVLEKSFAYPRDVLERLAETGATVLPGVPTIFATVLQMTPVDDVDLSSVRLLTNTAAALPPAHIERLGQAFPEATIFCMYGLTECTRVSYLDPERLDDKMGSVGRAMPNTETYIVDEHGDRVGPGVEGELVVRGASVMRGYWGKPEATAACLRDGEIEGEKVLHTGDRFWVDDEGFLYFVGRRDDVFKCKGEKISPKEIEHVLYELEDVGEAAVIGVPDEIDGTAIKVVVAPRPGADLTEDHIRRHCRARLENYMVPRHVEVRDALPKTDSGKIRKAALVLENA
ncbi:MAG TPA: AMP-binding protein [Acidimicrobiales bacterium]|nr:AMP-binding protein [Acidimicrobiales bacterium]